MHAAITVTWFTGVLLLSLRLGAVLLMTPLLATASVPLLVRVLIVLGLSAALSLGLPSGAIPAASAAAILRGAGPLLAAGLAELALGATLALGILLAFGAFSVAGQLLGVQVGFGLGQVIDPASSAALPILTSVFNQLAVVVFFLVDGHHAVLRGVAYSVERFPLGRPWPVEAAFAPVLKQVAGLFTLGFALAAPVVLCILLVDVALGVVARHLPQMNMLTMGIPLKVVVALVAIPLWLSGIRGVMGRAYEGIYRSWDETFEAAAPPAAPADATRPPFLPPVPDRRGSPGVR